MNIFPIPEALAEKYKGSGPALASIDTEGNVVDIRYIRDIVPTFDDEVASVSDVVSDPRIGSASLDMNKRGEVSIGMLSAWEFCEL